MSEWINAKLLHDLIMLHGPLDEHDRRQVRALYNVALDLLADNEHLHRELRMSRAGRLRKKVQHLEDVLDDIEIMAANRTTRDGGDFWGGS